MEYLSKVVVLGDIATGKTSFINRAVHSTFTDAYKSTMAVDFALKCLSFEHINHRLQFWDIAGPERFGNMTRVYYKEAVSCIIMIDSHRQSTCDGALKWLSDFDMKLDDAENIPRYLIVNKIDLIDADEMARIDQWILLHALKFSKIYKISCKNCASFDQILMDLSADILQYVRNTNDIDDTQNINNDTVFETNEESVVIKQTDDKSDSQNDIVSIQNSMEPRALQKYVLDHPDDIQYLTSKELKQCFDPQTMRHAGTNIKINSILSQIAKYPERMKYEYYYKNIGGIDDEQLAVSIYIYFKELGYECTHIFQKSVIIKW